MYNSEPISDKPSLLFLHKSYLISLYVTLHSEKYYSYRISEDSISRFSKKKEIYKGLFPGMF